MCRLLRYPSRGWLLATLFLCSCHASARLGDEGCVDGADGCQSAHVKVCHQPTMRALAKDLDHLEEHIEKHGSIVAQAPAVWGQARLTKYRQEFEHEIFKAYGDFKETLQGSLSRSDQAFFANATSLGLAAQAASGTSGTSATAVAAASDLGTTDFDKAFKRNDARLPNAIGFKAAVDKIALEPTLFLEQKKRYLNFLDQIRRTNEGDDTADSPGYSLNLIRIPVSVLPGKCTDTGHGGEITFALNPILGEELLPTTFRNLVRNDLVDHLGVPLTFFLDDRELVKEFLTEDHWELLNIDNPKDISASLEVTNVTSTYEGAKTRYFAAPEASNEKKAARLEYLNAKKAYVAAQPNLPETFNRLADKVARKISLPGVSASKVRGAQLPFPPSQMYDVYGLREVFNIAYFGNKALQRDILARKYAHLPDVQSYLTEELNAAFKLLDQPQNQHLWIAHCTPHLVAAIRSRQLDVLRRLRQQFRAEIHAIAALEPTSIDAWKQNIEYTTTSALAWAILVDSALLTEQLVQDMKETAAAKGCALSCDWLPYYLPCPPPEARAAFNEYVRCRWPVRVFALDPATQDQNIADSFSSRRETQLALSIAFVSGKLSASNLTRYSRRLESEFETIALNRTQVGFSHGDNVFGWRFQPRFQTPPTESNLTVLFRDQLIGGPSREAVLVQRQLEPGPRDCVAIVMMPSFIPYLTCDVSSSWYKLTNPKCKVMDTRDALRLSRSVRAIQNCAHNVQDAHCYRDGELMRLIRKSEQLDARLPLQTRVVQVPYENTLGGFEMFNAGITDLAPELLGWYGAAGIDPSVETVLFLVGDNFSVNQTRVLAGNRPCAHTLLSRQVMQVSIPPGAQVRGDGKVEVHVATPYGVTSTLAVPAYAVAAAAAEAAPEGYAISPEKLTVGYRIKPLPLSEGKYVLAYNGLVAPNDRLKLTWNDASGSVPLQAQLAFHFDIGEKPFTVTTPAFTVSGPPNKASDSFAFSTEQVELLAKCVIETLNGRGPFTEATDPLAKSIRTTKIEVTPIGAGIHATRTVLSNTALTIEFVGELVPCPLPAPRVQ